MLLFIESIIAYHEDRISIEKEDPSIYGFENMYFLDLEKKPQFYFHSIKINT